MKQMRFTKIRFIHSTCNSSWIICQFFTKKLKNWQIFYISKIFFNFLPKKKKFVKLFASLYRDRWQICPLIFSNRVNKLLIKCLMSLLTNSWDIIHSYKVFPICLLPVKTNAFWLVRICHLSARNLFLDNWFIFGILYFSAQIRYISYSFLLSISFETPKNFFFSVTDSFTFKQKQTSL